MTIFIWKTQAFTEAGLDSLGAVELRNALSQYLDIELPATLVFDYPSINAIATYIVASMGGGEETFEMTVSGSKARAHRSSFHSVQPVFASSNVVAKTDAEVMEIFAVSSRLPSPAGMIIVFIHLFVS